LIIASKYSKKNDYQLSVSLAVFGQLTDVPSTQRQRPCYVRHL